jgi:hypothetical protein
MITPSQLSWDDQGDIVCSVHFEGEHLAGSIEGSGR